MKSQREQKSKRSHVARITVVAVAVIDATLPRQKRGSPGVVTDKPGRKKVDGSDEEDKVRGRLVGDPPGESTTTGSSKNSYCVAWCFLRGPRIGRAVMACVMACAGRRQ